MLLPVYIHLCCGAVDWFCAVLVIYFPSMTAAAGELKRFRGSDTGLRRLFRLVWIPHVAAGCFGCCSGAWNQNMEPGAAFGFAAASSFGDGSGMFAYRACRADRQRE